MLIPDKLPVSAIPKITLRTIRMSALINVATLSRLIRDGALIQWTVTGGLATVTVTNDPAAIDRRHRLGRLLLDRCRQINFQAIKFLDNVSVAVRVLSPCAVLQIRVRPPLGDPGPSAIPSAHSVRCGGATWGNQFSPGYSGGEKK